MITARIATKEGNYLVAIPVYCGEPILLYLKKDMKTVIREASVEEWLWATTGWDSVVEQGEWEFSEEQQQDFFRKQAEKFSKKEEIVKKYFTEVPPRTVEEYEVIVRRNLSLYEPQELWEMEVKMLTYRDYNREEFEADYLEYIEQSYKVYEKIAQLPKSLPIIKLQGESFNGDKYSGGTYSAKLSDYTGILPAIVVTNSSEYWRGNSSRARWNYYLVKENKIAKLIHTKTQGDGFGIVNDSNMDCDFETIYKATHI